MAGFRVYALKYVAAYLASSTDIFPSWLIRSSNSLSSLAFLSVCLTDLGGASESDSLVTSTLLFSKITRFLVPALVRLLLLLRLLDVFFLCFLVFLSSCSSESDSDSSSGSDSDSDSESGSSDSSSESGSARSSYRSRERDRRRRVPRERSYSRGSYDDRERRSESPDDRDDRDRR